MACASGARSVPGSVKKRIGSKAGMSVAAIPAVVESAVAIRTKGRTLMISRSPARRVTGALKLCLASATIGLRTSRSPLRARLVPPSLATGRGATVTACGNSAKVISPWSETQIAEPIRPAPVMPVSTQAVSQRRFTSRRSARGEAAPDRSSGGSRPGSADRPRGACWDPTGSSRARFTVSPSLDRFGTAADEPRRREDASIR